MKKILLLTAAALIIQVTPVLADHHMEDKGPDGKGKMFEMQDTNSDGQISEAEFLAHAKVKFSEMDANKDGSITPDEAKAAREEKRKEMKEKWKEKRGERKERSEEKSAE